MIFTKRFLKRLFSQLRPKYSFRPSTINRSLDIDNATIFFSTKNTQIIALAPLPTIVERGDWLAPVERKSENPPKNVLGKTTNTSAVQWGFHPSCCYYKFLIQSQKSCLLWGHPVRVHDVHRQKGIHISHKNLRFLCDKLANIVSSRKKYFKFLLQYIWEYINK